MDLQSREYRQVNGSDFRSYENFRQERRTRQRQQQQQQKNISPSDLDNDTSQSDLDFEYPEEVTLTCSDTSDFFQFDISNGAEYQIPGITRDVPKQVCPKNDSKTGITRGSCLVVTPHKTDKISGFAKDPNSLAPLNSCYSVTCDLIIPVEESFIAKESLLSTAPSNSCYSVTCDLLNPVVASRNLSAPPPVQNNGIKVPITREKSAPTCQSEFTNNPVPSSQHQQALSDFSFSNDSLATRPAMKSPGSIFDQLSPKTRSKTFSSSSSNQHVVRRTNSNDVPSKPTASHKSRIRSNTHTPCSNLNLHSSSHSGGKGNYRRTNSNNSPAKQTSTEFLELSKFDGLYESEIRMYFEQLNIDNNQSSGSLTLNGENNTKVEYAEVLESSLNDNNNNSNTSKQKRHSQTSLKLSSSSTYTIAQSSVRKTSSPNDSTTEYVELDLVPSSSQGNNVGKDLASEYDGLYESEILMYIEQLQDNDTAHLNRNGDNVTKVEY
eukprot:Awhi_evm1s631